MKIVHRRGMCYLVAFAAFAGNGLASAEESSIVGIFQSPSLETPPNPVDEPILRKLKEFDIQPAPICSDAVFVRRVYLDLIGMIPPAGEARRFIEDKNPDKRRLLIDELLAREEFADYWAMKWCDALRVKSEFPINLWPNAVQCYYRWIRTSIHENKPYDVFVREILTANGSNFRVPQVNFFRAVQGNDPATLARAVALSFMGSRAEKWPPERLEQMAVFFSTLQYKKTAEWKEEIVFVDLFGVHEEGSARRPAKGILPDGTEIALPADKDPRAVFADWLIRRENPWFARNAVNRVWYWLLGRGIVHEPDDLRPDNPPVNPELLAVLEQELVRSDYDLRHLYRLILNSAAYQRSSVPTTDRTEAEAQFAHYPLRRLDAEVLIDAICQVTGTTEEYWSMIPEPFTFVPKKQRSVRLADGSITSAFLELFGRPPRDSGLVSERNNKPTASQALHLLNSTHVRQKIEASPALASGLKRNDPTEIVTELYLRILSRYPTEEELEILREYAKSSEAKGRGAIVDLMWALLNSSEFLYRH